MDDIVIEPIEEIIDYQNVDGEGVIIDESASKTDQLDEKVTVNTIV